MRNAFNVLLDDRQNERQQLPTPYFEDAELQIRFYHGDCLEILPLLPEESVDLIFADPPYFLSNGGITCHAGRMVNVDKGTWDRSRGADANHAFNREWLAACRRVLKPDGTIWVSGTAHVIHSVGFALQQLGFKLLNDITWVKPNPPPNLSCRYFTHATETIIWAAKSAKSRHTFNYRLMKQLNGGRQMKSVWTIPPPEPQEKRFGKHPTQKPVALLERILLAASNKGDVVLDPFLGSGTTAVAAVRLSRMVLAIEQSGDCADLAQRRIVAELVRVDFFVSCTKGLDLVHRPVDRSRSRTEHGMTSRPLTKLMQQERMFYFVGAVEREVIFSVTARTMEEAWERFCNSPKAGKDVFCVIKTETEIYLAVGK